MHRRVYSIVGFVLLVLLILGLATGCGETEEPTATSAPPTQKPPGPTVPPTAMPESAEQPDREVDDPQQAELDSAIEEYTQAIALDPQDAEAYFNRGLAYARAGQYEQALADFGKVLKLDPANAQAYYVCGQLHAELEEREEAIAYLERALDLGLSPEMKQYAEELLRQLGRE